MFAPLSIFAAIVKRPLQDNPWGDTAVFPSNGEWVTAWAHYKDVTRRNRLTHAWFWQVWLQCGADYRRYDDMCARFIRERDWLTQLMPYAKPAVRVLPSPVLGVLRPIVDRYATFTRLSPAMRTPGQSLNSLELASWLWFGTEEERRAALPELGTTVELEGFVCAQAALLVSHVPQLALAVAQGCAQEDIALAHVHAFVALLGYWPQDVRTILGVAELEPWYQMGLHASAGLGDNDVGPAGTTWNTVAERDIEVLRETASVSALRAFCEFAERTANDVDTFFQGNFYTEAIARQLRQENLVPSDTTAFYPILAMLFPPYTKHVQHCAAMGLALNEMLTMLPACSDVAAEQPLPDSWSA